MAKSKNDLEKRQREKAARLKHIKAASKRMMAKQQKAHKPSGKGSRPADKAADGTSLYENPDHAGSDEGTR
jgi:hypothetical protein